MSYLLAKSADKVLPTNQSYMHMFSPPFWPESLHGADVANLL